MRGFALFFVALGAVGLMTRLLSPAQCYIGGDFTPCLEWPALLRYAVLLAFGATLLAVELLEPIARTVRLR